MIIPAEVKTVMSNVILENNSATTDAPAANPRRLRMLIGSDWVDSDNGESMPVENPATGEVFAHAPIAGAAEVHRAVAAARSSFDSKVWRGLPASERSRIMCRIVDLMERNYEELSRLETLDNGMPVSKAPRMIRRAIERMAYYAGMPTKIYGRTADVGGAGEFHAYTKREPVGVAALILPWNGPLGMICSKVAPALAAGCSVVVKPAEQTPMTALRFAELCLEAGLPAGTLNVVLGPGATTGEELVKHRDVNKISFTGSTAIGKRIVSLATERLCRVSLELGGKSPVFLFDDADMDVALPAAVAGIFGNSGQACIAGSRLYIQRGCFDKVLNGLVDLAGKIRVGNGADPTTEIGPLISRRQLDRVKGYLDSGLEQGATLATGGKVIDSKGYFVEPTIFTTHDASLRIAQEEIFGPVLTVMPFDTLADVARLGNDTRYGLGAGIYTQNTSTAHLAASALEAGNVWVNCYGVLDPTMPFGGYKESGWGRESSLEGIDAFLEHKSVYVNLKTRHA